MGSLEAADVEQGGRSGCRRFCGVVRAGDVEDALAAAGVPVRREADHPLGELPQQAVAPTPAAGGR